MSVRRLFPVVLFAAIAGLAVQHAVDPDMWWHLATGKAILADGIPHVDRFSYTYPGNEWVAHEWLSQVVMWLTYRAAGMAGLMILFGAIVTATFAVVYRLCRGKPYIAGAATFLAATGTTVVWGVRVQLVSLLLLSVFMLLITRLEEGRASPRLWLAFPALTVLWVNLHSGFLLGIVVLGTHLVGDAFEWWRSKDPERGFGPVGLRRLATAIAGCVVAALANPNGLRMLTYPFETLGSPVQRRFITEWHPPSPGQPLFWILLSVGLIAVLGMYRAPGRPSFTDMLLIGGTALGGALSARNVPIFAVVAAPIVARYWTEALDLAEDPAPAERPGAATLAVATVAIVAAVAVAATTIATNEDAVAASFPVAAVDWIESQTSTTRTFNAYGWGGYLIWRGHEVYIDGRADVYGDEGLLDFASIYFAETGWQERLDERQIDVVLVQPGSTMATAMRSEPRWSVGYEDELSVVFERAG